MRKKLFSLLLVGCLGMILSGCSQVTELAATTTTTSTTTTSTTTTSTTISTGTTLLSYKLAIQGKLASVGMGQSVQGLAVVAFSSTEGDLRYEDRYITPSSYEVGVVKAELVKSDDTTFEVFNFGGINNYRGFDLTTAHSTVFGSSETYPNGGSYTALKLTVAYLKMKLKMNLGVLDNFQYRDHEARIWASTVTEEVTTYRKRDLQVYHGGTWYWIDTANWSFSATRPASAAQGLDLISGDPGVAIISLAPPLIIPSNPGGSYSGTITFDISDTFFFDDLDGNNKFEPVVPPPNGDWSGYFWPLMPTLTLSFESVSL